MIKSITNFLIIFSIFQQLKSQISKIDGYNAFCDETLHFLLRYAPDCTFPSRKMKISLPWEGGHPSPARSLRSLGLGRFAPSQRLCPPPNVLAHYATGSKEVQTRLIMTDKFTTLRGVRSRSRSEKWI